MKKTNPIEKVIEAETKIKYEKERRKNAEKENKFLKKKLKRLRSEEHTSELQSH